VTLKPGFNLVANPLTAADNSIGNLFKNVTGGSLSGYTVYKLVGADFVTAVYDDLDNVFNPPEARAQTVTPGNGVFVFNPNDTADLTLTFVGEVPQGTLSNPIPQGFSIKANQVPQAGKPDAFGLAGGLGDTVFRYNTTDHGYDTFNYDDLDNVWNPVLPSINVGEAFLYFRGGDATTWNRTFNVNTP